MITGDYPGTARAIAHQIGLANPELVTTGAEIAGHERVGAARAGRPMQRLRARRARAEAAAGRGAEGQRRDRGDDRRRRQRRAGAQGRAHRRRDGQARLGCRARGRVAGAARGRFRLDGRGGQARASDLRQHPEGDALHRRRARADRRNGAAAAGVRLAAGALPGPHRVPRVRHRSGELDRVRGRAGRAQRHEPAAAARELAPVRRAD